MSLGRIKQIKKWKSQRGIEKVKSNLQHSFRITQQTKDEAFVEELALVQIVNWSSCLNYSNEIIGEGLWLWRENGYNILMFSTEGSAVVFDQANHR